MESGCWRESFVAERQQNLGEGSSAGSGKQMADVGFDRTDNAPALRIGAAPEFAQAGHFGGVADRGAGGMALDQVHIRSGPAGGIIGGTHRPELPLGHRRKQAAANIVSEPHGADDPVNMVPMGYGIFGPFEQEDPGAFTDHQSVAESIEG
ncbi:hypothetical protein OR1_04155 [Geobacter sp. OR-1]|nr:hypothetical protein OR1_04155 [Geobacter sp. OR-1]